MLENKDAYIEKMVDNLPVIRKKLRLSQEALADIIGMDRSSVARIETGKMKMSWSIFMLLLLYFDKNEAISASLMTFNIYDKTIDDYINLEYKKDTINTDK